MPDLTIVRLTYPQASLEAWKAQRYRMLTSSGASRFLKRILKKKASGRGGTRRFFGEAYVAVNTPHTEGFYGSFKWLTNPRFSDGRPFPDGQSSQYQKELRRALVKYFGTDQLVGLRKRAIAFRKRTGIVPVPPDLWLIDRYGNHRFIEVKLPGDSIKDGQLAGLALIATSLFVTTRISVEIADLTPDYGESFRACRKMLV